MVQKTFDCDNIVVNISRNGDSPLTATVATEKGLWIEIPPNKHEGNMFFYNIATSKIAVFSLDLIGGVNTLVLQTYRSKDFYDAHQSEMNLRCRKIATQSIHH